MNLHVRPLEDGSGVVAFLGITDNVAGGIEIGRMSNWALRQPGLFAAWKELLRRWFEMYAQELTGKRATVIESDVPYVRDDAIVLGG